MPGKTTAPVVFGKGSAMSLDELRQHEAVIEGGLDHFLSVGKALAAIRDGKAYKLDGYKTFEDYCDRRWHFSRQAGYAYIGAAKAAENVNTSFTKPVGHQVARELARLPDAEAQQEVAETVYLDTATAAQVRAAVDEKLAPTPEQIAQHPILAKARVRHSTFAIRSTWSRAMGTMSAMVRVHEAAEVADTLSPAEVRQTLDAIKEWRVWGEAFEALG